MFNKIDFKSWPRKEIYQRFFGVATYVTADLDITEFLKAIRSKGLSFYPSMTYCLGKVINSDKDFRLGTVDGQPGYWDSVGMLFNVRRKDVTEEVLFSHKLVPFSHDFYEFYNRFSEGKRLAEYESGGLYYDKDLPLEHADISITKSLAFSAISFGGIFETPRDMCFVPFATIGKYTEKEGRTTMPLAVEFHHAVNDGYHYEKYFAAAQTFCDRINEFI